MLDESSPSLLMSQLIAADAPLLSPVSPTDPSWDSNSPLYNDSFNYNYFYPSPPSSTDSPSPAPRMLKSRTSSNSSFEQELCLPTHQVFNFTQMVQAPLPLSPVQSNAGQSYVTLSSDDRPLSSASSTVSSSAHPSETTTHATKRMSAAPDMVAKKPRSGERISVRDFVPPDVTGLSKREARLVKNRAAAFLSRQRKREEFENMEVRLSELEQENARLLALTQDGNSSAQPKEANGDLASELEQLRAQLAAARDRERELSAELAMKKDASIKLEPADTQVPISPTPRTSSTTQSPNRSGTSFGLMVLLCALPSLLSMPVNSTAASTFSVPDHLPISSFDCNPYLPSDYDWTRANNQIMMDTDEQQHFNTASAPRNIPITHKLQFTDVDVPALAGLGGLDISFDASLSEDGKIRVRIHPVSSAEYQPELSSGSAMGRTDVWQSYQSTSNALSSSYLPPASKDDPFFGIDISNDYGILSPIASPTSIRRFGQLPIPTENSQYSDSDSTFAHDSQFVLRETSTSHTRRVRIALKSLPAADGEGGEWEVQIC